MKKRENTDSESNMLTSPSPTCWESWRGREIGNYRCINPTPTMTRSRCYKGFLESTWEGTKLFHFTDDRGIHNTASPKRFVKVFN